MFLLCPSKQIQVWDIETGNIFFSQISGACLSDPALRGFSIAEYPTKVNQANLLINSKITLTNFHKYFHIKHTSKISILIIQLFTVCW